MEIWPRKYCVRDWLSVISVVASALFGPVFYAVGESLHLVFGAAGIFYFGCCIFIVPLLTFVAGRWRYVAWQAAVLSVTIAVIHENFILNALNLSEVGRVAFMFWATGTLFSAPLPLYYFLKAMTPRRRLIFGLVVGLLGIALWIEVKRITG